MTVSEKIEKICRQYSQSDIARKLTSMSGRVVPLSTVNAYLHGKSKKVRIKAVAQAIDKLYDSVKYLEG